MVSYMGEDFFNVYFLHSYSTGCLLPDSVCLLPDSVSFSRIYLWLWYINLIWKWIYVNHKCANLGMEWSMLVIRGCKEYGMQNKKIEMANLHGIS